MLEEGKKITFRIVTIGDSSVGKTSLLKKFLSDEFDINEQNTIGAFFQPYTLQRGDKTIELQLWDTAGQEQYRSLGSVYFRDSAAALLVFDITNKTSFTNAGEWLRTFRETCDNDPVVILVGNKCDLSMHQVSFEEAKSWSRENNCSYIATSAKTGEGVNLLFQELVNLLIDRHSDNVDTEREPKTLEIEEEYQASGCC